MRNTSRNAKRRKKTMKRVFTNIVLAPGKMPRMNAEKTERIMGICEIVSLVFVATLMLHLMVPEIMPVIVVFITGAAFVSLLMMILLGEYQDKLVEYELYGFKI